MLKKICSKLFALIIILAILIAAFPINAFAETTKNCYIDVRDDSWYSSCVDYCYNKGLFSGIDKNHFAPNELMSRAMAVVVLSRVAQIVPYTHPRSPFKDVSRYDWYTPAVSWAYYCNIIYGKSYTNFSPYESISREEICVILRRYTANNNIELEMDYDSIPFLDEEDVSSWARKSVEDCRMAGIINGYEDGNFYPRNNITRAEVASIFKNFCEKYIDTTNFTPIKQKQQSETKYVTMNNYLLPEVKADKHKRGKDYDAVVAAINKIGINKNMTEEAAVKLIFDYIIGHCSYDYSTANNYKNVIYNCLNGQATCIGYSSAFEAMCLYCGIQAETVCGAAEISGGYHAWNRAVVNGKTLYYDVTYADGIYYNRYYALKYINHKEQFVADFDYFCFGCDY